MDADWSNAIGQTLSSDEYNKQYDRLEMAYANANAKNLLTEQDEQDLKLRIAAEEAKLSFLKDDSEEILNNF